MSFKPIHDLESLTDLQREQHYMDACAYFELPPELRLLDFMWMDSSDGKRNLVLYSKKGATDLIRDRRGISVISTVPANGPGYAAFIVEGKDINGRHEFAVGSASIAGLTGQNLANAIMIAHTRATRRMTLQFVGGLLDESEAQGPVTDINRAGGSLASLATLPAPIQPIAAPNTEPGKDITSPSGVERALGLTAPSALAVALMSAPAPFSGGSIIPAQVEQITETSQPLVQIEPAIEAPKRHRRTKAEMAATRGVISLDSPVSTDVESALSVEKPSEASKTTPVKPLVVEIPLEVAPVPTVNPDKSVGTTEIPVEINNPDTPTKEEVAVWKSKLSVYTTQGGILNQGGMIENLFGKIRLYTMKLFPNAIVLPNKAIMLTNTQWGILLDTFSTTVAEKGPTGLVNAIEAAAK